MAEFEIPIQPLDLPKTDPNGGSYKNVKEIKSGDGSFYIYDGKIELKDPNGDSTERFSASVDGIFLGGADIASAKFSVLKDGTMKSASSVISGTITAETIVDSTYGFNGIFVKQIKTTDFSSNPAILPIYKSDGLTRITTGLLSVYANWYQTSTNRLNFLPGINNSTNTSYWSVQKDGSSQYEIRHLGANQASELPSPGYIIYTCLFNSDETTYF